MGSALVKDKSTLPFDAAAAKQQFPLIAQNSYLSYLDSGATSQKPQTVIDSQVHFYTSQNANIHRGVYQLSHEATRLYDESRETVRRFLNAKHASEVIFTSGATEGINLIAQSFGRANLKKDDEILLSTMEHHSNIVPWQLLAQEVGAVIKVIPVTDAGELDLPAFTALLSERTRIVSIVHVSNALGTLNPVAEITALAHSYGAVVVIDGAQAAPHLLTDVQLLDCDFYVFSGHKVYAPMGTGALYGRQSLLQNMPPYKGGGDMILSVSFAETTFQDAPERFEAGTPNVAGAVGLAAAIEFVESFDAACLACI
jgi:cysteine desulfurase/selenocysteine lyase